MSNIDDGGSAFPITGPATDEDLDRRFYGMTLRDYFAAKAMQMLRTDLKPDWSAARAYEMADAMLEARK
jgi:hypothetical protein